MGFLPNNSCRKLYGFDQHLVSILHSECWIDEPGLRSVSFVVPTRTHVVGPVRDHLVGRDAGIDVTLRISQPQVCMAVEEALSNAVFHGNLEIDSKLKDDGSSSFRELAQERQENTPWKDRVVRICRLVSSLGLFITITDEGAGFNTQQALAKMPELTALLSSGRGLMMMRAFTDGLFFNDRGNSVTLAFHSVHQGRQWSNVKQTA